MRKTIFQIALCTAVCGCSTGLVDSTSGGADNLPTLGAGPFGKPTINFDTPADEPFVVVDRTANLTDPSVSGRDDGGFRLWFQRQVTPDDPSAIWAAEIPAITELPDVPAREVLIGETGWEQGSVGEPSVLKVEGEHWVMFYRGGTMAPAIGRADSNDGGYTWTKHPQNPIVTNATEPAIGISDRGWLLAFTRPNAPGILASWSSDGIGFDAVPQTVISARPNKALAFDRDGVGSPHLQIRVTPADREHFALWFAGTVIVNEETSVTSVGYAASFDGNEWFRFGDLEPVLDGGSPSEFAPTATARTTDAFLFYSELDGVRQRIGVATHP